ncbi:MAG: glycoside hydrolase [Verrucomicrobia bacterium]|nr:MAG: glycoside hydrolase [Verrucomicrobiota bacterium]
MMGARPSRPQRVRGSWVAEISRDCFATDPLRAGRPRADTIRILAKICDWVRAVQLPSSSIMTPNSSASSNPKRGASRNCSSRFTCSLTRLALILFGCVFAIGSRGASSTAEQTITWPAESRETRPWAYWWWMGSAVDSTNIIRELTRYRDAGMGGVHIIPIYGAVGWEDKYIPYLSPKWMEMLDVTVTQARNLGLDVDMTTGTGWCFGGPRVTDDEANASLVCKIFNVTTGGKLEEKFNRTNTQALVAFGADGKHVDLTKKISPDGSVNWLPASGPWKVYAVSQKPSGQKVKRPALGGEGHMLNLFYGEAMKDYLKWFDDAFKNYQGPKPRAQYHDSYEYKSDWSPDFFAQFEKRRGYRLQDELPALVGDERSRRREEADSTNAAPVRLVTSSATDDRAARVKCDYRETASDLMAEVTLPMWAAWSKKNGFLTRNEAHGSPGNWLDLYAVADMPETEMFYKDRNKLISKFASSAAHVAGKQRVTCETGTWLNEHFTETLADMKYLQDDLFLSGVNHIFYHGTCYSPDEAGWPGWHFYASYEMNPRNSVWRDVPALNAYASRCQAVLQAGQPDNDILLYWPVHDFWHDASGSTRNLTVHARDWFEDQPIGHTAAKLWARGYSFDYVSDRQLAGAQFTKAGVKVAGGTYRTIVVPPCEHIPVETFRRLLALAKSGATVIFADKLPSDVPGLGKLEQRRTELRKLKSGLGAPMPAVTNADSCANYKLGRGWVSEGDVEVALTRAGVKREAMFDRPGLMCIRRAVEGGNFYFIANRGETTIDDWIPLARPATSVVIDDALAGKSGVGDLKGDATNAQVYLQLQPGQSVILRTFADRDIDGPWWSYWRTAQSDEITTAWRVEFISGGPVLPTEFQINKPDSWTSFPNEEAKNFAGTARYSTTFNAPEKTSPQWLLDLGKVCQSARVKLNGQDLGTLITPPFTVVVKNLKPKGNLLEVEVTNVSANRIRDLDRRGVKWKNYHDINFVNLNYRPFDASNWPLTDSGLLGPVTLTALVPRSPSLEAAR